MIPFLRRFVAVLLLAWLPVQAAALPALAMLCEQEHSVAHHDPSFGGEHAHHDAIGPHSHADGDEKHGGTTHDHASGCCHHLYSAAPVVFLEAPNESGSNLDLTSFVSLSSFFPEQPQRPPLA